MQDAHLPAARPSRNRFFMEPTEEFDRLEKRRILQQ